MSLINVDLVKEPEVAAMLADAQPGDCIYGCFRLKTKDDQTATLRIDGMAKSKDELPEHDDEDDDANPNDVEDDTKPEGGEEMGGKKAGSMGQRIAAKVASGDTTEFM